VVEATKGHQLQPTGRGLVQLDTLHLGRLPLASAGIDRGPWSVGYTRSRLLSSSLRRSDIGMLPLPHCSSRAGRAIADELVARGKTLGKLGLPSRAGSPPPQRCDRIERIGVVAAESVAVRSARRPVLL